MAKKIQIGSFVKQTAGYKAFIPSKFPPDNFISWNNVLVTLLSKAERAIGKLDAIDELIPDVDLFILMYAKKEAALSSQIEGTQATFIDYLKEEAKIDDKEIPSDVDEIKNYIKAMNHGVNRIKSLPLSWRLIREIHIELLKGVRGKHKSPGEFRKTQNWIGGPTIETAVFVPPPPHEMKSALDDLEKFFHNHSSIPILIKAALLHAQFETIHPFLDGNGRIGRLLITFYLIKEGVLTKPLLYLSEFFKKNRIDYYDKLNFYRKEDGVENWIRFFLEGIRTVSNEAILTAKKITKLKEKDIELVSKFGKNSDTALILLKNLFKSPIIDLKLAQKITSIRSKTNISSLIEKFEKAEILFETSGKQRNKRFEYKDYVKLLERE
ncbi:Fic family protein [Candidatus Peregrinibacteria bacterium]|nr:Fic family protein [Candidatus Peregrinibacteria bacterium]